MNRLYSLVINIFIMNHVRSQCLEIFNSVRNDTGVMNSQIWYGKASHIERCVKMCVRRTACMSMNYNLRTGMCELNNATIYTAPVRSVKNLMYADMAWVPAEIDPTCYSRPCGLDEVCIPNQNDQNCSYICMPAGRPVCPMPSTGVSNGRYVGDVNEFKCRKGFIGGDSATCLPGGKWSKTINKKCTRIHNSTCKDDTFCSLINGTCITGRCQCGNLQTYNTSSHECELELSCGHPPHVINATSIWNSTTATYECWPGWSPSHGDNTTILCTEQGWQQTNLTCTKLSCGHPPHVINATSIWNSTTATYECWPGWSPSHGDNTTILCTEQGWQQTNLTCTKLSCGHPPHVINATSIWNSTTATYECWPGWTPSHGDNATILCTEQGWQQTNLTCIKLSCGHPPHVINATSTWNSTTATYECWPGWSPSHGDNTTILCTEQGWQQTNLTCTKLGCDHAPSIYGTMLVSYSIYSAFYKCFEGWTSAEGPSFTIKCVNNKWQHNNISCYNCGFPPDVTGATITGNITDMVRNYTCDMYPELEPKPNTTNGTVTCTEGGWEPHGFLCYGVRLFHVKQTNNTPHFSYIGYLQMFTYDHWRYFDVKGWSWRETMVACREINSTLNYGGTYHVDWNHAIHPVDYFSSYHVTNVNCTGNEDSLDECQYNVSLEENWFAAKLVITCFDFDVMAGTNVYLPESGILSINLTSYSGVVCADRTLVEYDEEATVACRTINDKWEVMKTYFSAIDDDRFIMAQEVQCYGDEPHFLYCGNAGWGWSDQCPTVLSVECGTT